MATYTDNYTMTKPTYAEQADISVINANMDIIDNVMHSSQISLAPAYDQNETYNTGDKVMYEKLMYKCKADGVTGAWDSTKWERTTAAEGSGGGADLDIYGEASGTAEASFSDGAEASLVECEIGIVPTQDLHGYSKPWAGGAGKNKVEYPYRSTIGTTWNGMSISDNNGLLSIEGVQNGATRLDFCEIALIANTTYTLSSNFVYDDTTEDRMPLTLYDFNTSTLIANIYSGNVTFTVTENHTAKLYLNPSSSGNTQYYKFTVNPMIEVGSTATTYEPYSNICPISGHTDVTVTVASTSGGSGDDTTVSLGRTVYGGTLDVTTGELTVTWDNIPSYAGETLTGEWLSSLDEYDALGTPTIGAQVSYELATPQTFNLTPTQVETLSGQNYVSHDGGGTISLVYVKGDAPIKPNPADAEIPLTGLEIDGEKFKIESGGYQIDTLLNETNGVTVGVTYGFLDGHTLSEYDEIELIIATKENVSGNLGYDRWVMSVQGLLDFPVINYGAYGQRWFHAAFTNNSFIQNNTSGDQYPYVYRIYGIKH